MSPRPAKDADRKRQLRSEARAWRRVARIIHKGGHSQSDYLCHAVDSLYSIWFGDPIGAAEDGWTHLLTRSREFVSDKLGCGPTIREAIDAARLAHPSQRAVESPSPLPQTTESSNG
jgi:hypothetical protein